MPFVNELTEYDLVLPDGRCVASLRVGALFRALSDLRTPGIDASMGKNELIGRYREQVVPAIEKLRPDLGRRPVKLDVQVMRQAAAMIVGAA